MDIATLAFIYEHEPERYQIAVASIDGFHKAA